MATYLDTSALVTLCTTEAESLALRRWLADAPQPLATSIVGEVELGRSRPRSAGLRRPSPRRCDVLWSSFR